MIERQEEKVGSGEERFLVTDFANYTSSSTSVQQQYIRFKTFCQANGKNFTSSSEKIQREMFPFAEEPGALRFRVMQLSTTDHVPAGGREGGRDKRIILQFKCKTLALFHKIMGSKIYILQAHFKSTTKIQNSVKLTSYMVGTTKSTLTPE